MDTHTFTDEFLKNLILKLAEENKNKYITGDFNFDLLQVANHTDTFDFLELMMTQLLMPTITIPTRITPVNNSLIDNIFTNDINPDMVTGNLTTGISDHLPSFIIIPRQNQNYLPKKHNIMKRDFKKFDKENFILDYLNIKWDEELELEKNDTNHSLGHFFQKINELLDKYMPAKVSQKEFKRRYKPWITDLILFKINNKNKVFKKYVKCKDATQKQSK